MFDDVVNGLSLIIPTSLRAIFEAVPWTRETLESVKETHVLVAVLPFSIMDLWRMLGNELFCDCQGEEWFKGKRYAEMREAPAWHLVRKDAVPNSASRSWAEQRARPAEHCASHRVRCMRNRCGIASLDGVPTSCSRVVSIAGLPARWHESMHRPD